MAYFEIHGAGQEAKNFPLEGFQISIGRSDDMDLVLPNVSVSRRHAILVHDDDGWLISDLASENGILINGERQPTHRLAPGDRVQIGKFLLVYFDQDVAGSSPDTMYDASSHGVDEEHTFTLKRGDMQRMMRVEQVARGARVHLASNPDKSWVPGEQSVKIGGKGDIPCDGWGAGATISWNRRCHVITKTGLLGKVLLNGEAIEEAELMHGDTFQVGKTTFLYKEPE